MRSPDGKGIRAARLDVFARRGYPLDFERSNILAAGLGLYDAHGEEEAETAGGRFARGCGASSRNTCSCERAA